MSKNQKENQFNFFVPASFEAGTKDFIIKGKKVQKDVVRVKGVASTSTSSDSDGETLFPDGFDYQPLLDKGFLNWDHQQKTRPSAIIGEPDVARIQNGGQDFYIEGFLYPDSKEAQECAQLAAVLEANSPTRRLGYSIEGQVIERGSNDKSSPLYKQVLRARITGVAITPCPKNPNTLLSLMKGEYSEAFVDSDELEYQAAIDIEKGGAGSGRHNKGDIVKIKNKAKGESDYVQGYNGKGTVVTDTPNDHGLLKVRMHKEEGFKDFNDHAYHKPEDLHKAMSAEGASDAGLIPEHIEGTKNPNKYPLDEDKEHKVARPIMKSDVYNLIAQSYTTDLVKAKQIFNFIKSVNQNLFNMTTTNEFSEEALTKAFDFLKKAQDETDIIVKAKTPEEEDSKAEPDEMEKAKEMCKGMMAKDKDKSRDNMVEDLVKSGLSLSVSSSAVDAVVSAASNLAENGGTIAAVTAPVFTGKDQELKKSESEDGQATMFATLLATITESNELVKGLSDQFSDKFHAVGTILKTQNEQNEILKSQLDTLSTEVEKIGKESMPIKSSRSVAHLEKSGFGGAALNTEAKYAPGTDVYNIDNREDREQLVTVIDAEIEKSRALGKVPSRMLEDIVANLETARTVLKEHQPTLRALNIAIESKK